MKMYYDKLIKLLFKHEKTIVEFYNFIGLTRQAHYIYKNRGFYPKKYISKLSDFLDIEEAEIEKYFLEEEYRGEFKSKKVLNIRLIPLETKDKIDTMVFDKRVFNIINDEIDAYLVYDDDLAPDFKVGDYAFIQNLKDKVFAKMSGFYLVKDGDYNKIKKVDFFKIDGIEFYPKCENDNPEIIGKVVGKLSLEPSKKAIIMG